jgi:hypothetical protein
MTFAWEVDKTQQNLQVVQVVELAEPLPKAVLAKPEILEQQVEQV